MRFLFVGEKPSARAIKIGASWRTGQLAAKTLHDALRTCGLEPMAQQFINLFGDQPDLPEIALASRVRRIRSITANGWVVVALGKKVSTSLTRHGVAHLRLTHPAARGAIRKTERYQAHVAQSLIIQLRENATTREARPLFASSLSSTRASVARRQLTNHRLPAMQS